MVVVRFSVGSPRWRATDGYPMHGAGAATGAHGSQRRQQRDIEPSVCLRWSSTTWSTNLSAISEGFPRQKAARHAAATTAGCNGIMTRTRTEATRTHSLMSPMLVTSDETGLESVGGEIVSGRADGSKGVRRRRTEDDCLAHGDCGCQSSSIAISSTRTQAVSSVCSLTASTLATLGFLLPAASHTGSRS